MKRKTINVDVVKTKANSLLANPNLVMEEKLGIITMIEHILHETDNYNGFRYLKLDSDGSAPKLGSESWVERSYY
jgi:hypothetical protein